MDSSLVRQTIVDECFKENSVDSATPSCSKDNIGCEIKKHAKTPKAVLIIVPVRLGLDRLQSDLISPLKKFFQMKHCAGIIGGRPRHALYFVGTLGHKFVYLDPHHCFDYCENLNSQEGYMPSFHTETVDTMDIEFTDPSMALGFLCRSLEEFDELFKLLKSSALVSPTGADIFDVLERIPSISQTFTSESLTLKLDGYESEEYEILS